MFHRTTHRMIIMSTKRGKANHPATKSSATKRKLHTGDEDKSPRKKAKTDDTMATSIVTIVTKHLKAASSPNTAKSMAKYMRDQFEYYGIGSPELKSNFKDKILVDSPAITTSSDLRSVLLALWNEPKRECQYIALKFAEKYLKLLQGETAEDCRESAQCLETLITTKSWWDTTDNISPNIVGPLAKERPDVLNPVLESWITHSNMWLRRAAILHQLKYKDSTDQEKLFRFCLLCCHEKEFFIQKSIGWALRQQFRVAPKAVKDFVKENDAKLATLSKREALKHA